MIICTATAAKLVKVKMLNDIAEQDMNISTEQKGKYFMSSKVYTIENKTEHAIQSKPARQCLLIFNVV